jgi:hypothetical protein
MKDRKLILSWLYCLFRSSVDFGFWQEGWIDGVTKMVVPVGGVVPHVFL